MIVSVDSRIVSAISFGVFCRSAPSTSAIIRSTKDSPGFVVIFTTIRSDSTVVPPVTAHRSPPDSRITGADSPVMADSSTVAMPSTTSPSPGITSPASTTTRSPIRRSVPGTRSSSPSSASRRATASFLVLRNESACALPRPSATASARFANSTVNHSHSATAMVNTLGSVDGEDRDQHRADPDDEHDRVAQLVARVELAQRVRERRQQLARVEIPLPTWPGSRRGGRGSARGLLEWWWSQQCLRDGTESESGNERQRGDQHDRCRSAAWRTAARWWAACPP